MFYSVSFLFSADLFIELCRKPEIQRELLKYTQLKTNLLRTLVHLRSQQTQIIVSKLLEFVSALVDLAHDESTFVQHERCVIFNRLLNTLLILHNLQALLFHC